MLSFVLRRSYQSIRDRRKMAAGYVAPFLRKFAKAMFGYWAAVRLDPPIPRDAGEPCTVVIASFRRMINIEPIVRAVLRVGFVDRVVVTNNNPEVRMARWLKVQDPRLTVLDQPVAQRPGFRFTLARDLPGDRFLVLDDDLFLSPLQITHVMRELARNPGAPHGVQGELFEPARHRAVSDIKYVEHRVNVLNRVYAFTRAHLDNYFRFSGELAQRGFDSVGYWDDVLLSTGGTEPPYVHFVGFWPDCPSGMHKQIAVYLSGESFEPVRTKVFTHLAELNPGACVPLPLAPPFQWRDLGPADSTPAAQ